MKIESPGDPGSQLKGGGGAGGKGDAGDCLDFGTIRMNRPSTVTGLVLLGKIYRKPMGFYHQI